jgi:hypothetical protein
MEAVLNGFKVASTKDGKRVLVTLEFKLDDESAGFSYLVGSYVEADIKARQAAFGELRVIAETGEIVEPEE